MKYVACAILLGSLIAIDAVAAEMARPPFLPDYYRPALGGGGRPLTLVSQRETNGVTQFIYATADKSEVLSVENINGDTPACRMAFNNIQGHLNQLITTNKGAFMEITETELHAEVILTNASQTVFALMLPRSVHIWTRSAFLATPGQSRPRFQEIRVLANRQRYEEALREGNVALGQWRKSIRDYAGELLKSGQKDEALAVLKNLLATSPFDYEAHFDFLENTPDSAAATNSAKVVFKNAEDPGQISRAARFLGAGPRTLDQIALLSTNDTGFQLVLIPLAPCNPWLLDEVAREYERITDIPVRIRRLDKAWTWGVPGRIARQRDAQGILVRLAKQNINFTNWTRERYGEALFDAVKPADALAKYWVRDLIGKIKSEPGQYSAGPCVVELSGLLKPYRSKDVRTLYVGITEANLYGGDDNFVFSVATTDADSHAGLMSYHMMLGKTLQEGFESRQRLAERVAKELVPASLKQLRIPRSTDPTCPYSYSSGVDRLDQKTLTLSDEVKQALNKLKDATTGASER